MLARVPLVVDSRRRHMDVESLIFSCRENLGLEARLETLRQLSQSRHTQSHSPFTAVPTQHRPVRNG